MAWTHGLTSYTAARCRCKLCKAAWAAYTRSRNAKIKNGEVVVATHGSGGYSQGCRCQECLVGVRAQRRAYAKAVRSGDTTIRHGLARYSLAGCRCDICRAAAKAYREAARKSPPSDMRHNLRGYNFYGCRCDICRAAAKAYRADRRTRQGDRRTRQGDGVASPRPAADPGQDARPRRRAAAEAKARRERGIPEDDPRHGTANGYDNYGCRCGPCTAAQSMSFQRRRERRRGRTGDSHART